MAEKKAILERSYTVPLRREFLKAPKWERTKRAISALKKFAKRHMKSENILLGKHINEFIWKNGAKNPPSKVKVDMVKYDDGTVLIEMVGAPKEKKEEEIKKPKIEKKKEEVKVAKEEKPKEEKAKEIEKEELKEIKKEKPSVKHVKEPTMAKDTQLRKKELIPGR